MATVTLFTRKSHKTFRKELFYSPSLRSIVLLQNISLSHIMHTLLRTIAVNGYHYNIREVGLPNRVLQCYIERDLIHIFLLVAVKKPCPQNI